MASMQSVQCNYHDQSADLKVMKDRLEGEVGLTFLIEFTTKQQVNPYPFTNWTMDVISYAKCGRRKKPKEDLAKINS